MLAWFHSWKQLLTDKAIILLSLRKEFLFILIIILHVLNHQFTYLLNYEFKNNLKKKIDVTYFYMHLTWDSTTQTAVRSIFSTFFVLIRSANNNKNTKSFKTR